MHRSIYVLTCMLLGLSGAGRLSAQSESASEDKNVAATPIQGEIPEWRESVQCGPNALYMLLRMNGWEGRLPQVRDAVPVNSTSGCSLAQLVDGSRRLGMPVRAIKTDISGLKRFQRPCIVHLDKSRSSNDAGHFAICLGIGSGALIHDTTMVTLNDPNAMREYELKAGEFERYWSSYTLIADSPSSDSWPRTDRLLVVGVIAMSSYCLAETAYRIGLLARKGRRDAAVD